MSIIPEPAHAAPHLTAQLNVAETVMTFPGPALLVSRTGDVLQANTAGDVLRPCLIHGTDGGLVHTIRHVADSGRTQQQRQNIAQPDAITVFHLLLMPVHTASHGTAVLVLGRDSSTDVQLQRALAESRQMFRDLVDCSADFAWETDTEGRFRFVSPKGALGFTARELNGCEGDELLVEDVTALPHAPFTTRLRVDEAEVQLRKADGTVAYVLISALPVNDSHGHWHGARGVCRDITDIRERERALARARERERLTQSLIDSIRSGLDPSQMLQTAANVMGEALSASQVMIFRGRSEEVIGALVGEYLVPDERPMTPPQAHWTATAPDAIVDHGKNGPHRVMSASCRYEGEMRGRLCVAWPHDADLPADVVDVINAISGQIGIVIAKAELQEKLALLSNTDDLTGLPNRRAFYDQVGRSIAHHRRHGRIGTLLYIDLDNFKAVNDTHGHKRGDEALCAVARLISDYPFRAGDIPGRIGGDEFAFWLEETDLDGARQVAQQIKERAGTLDAYSGSPDKPLTLSIGIAAMDDGVPEDLEAILVRADAAMYQVKHTQKGQIAVAAAPIKAPTD